RALVDSASLLWRWQVTTARWFGVAEAPPAAAVLDAVDDALVDRPQTPFVALHAALALAAAAQRERLQVLHAHLRDAGDPTMRTVVATIVEGLLAVLDEEWRQAAARFDDVLPVLVQVG